MSSRPVKLLIEDMLEAGEKIRRYSGGMTQVEFEADEKTADAVVRNMEIIGEAATRLPEEFRTQHGEIEWLKIVGLRNRIVHGYFGVDLEIVWRIIEHDLPAFEGSLRNLLCAL